MLSADVSQVSYLEEAPRDLCLSDQICHCSTAGPQVWCLLVNGTLLAFDPDTRTRTCKVREGEGIDYWSIKLYIPPS